MVIIVTYSVSRDTPVSLPSLLLLEKNVNEDKAMTLEDTVRKIILTLTERPFLHEEIKGVPALIAFH